MNSSISEAIVIVSAFFSSISVLMAAFALIDVWAFKRSTHKIQYIQPPFLDEETKLLREERLEEFNKKAEDPNYRYSDPYWSPGDRE